MMSSSEESKIEYRDLTELMKHNLLPLRQQTDNFNKIIGCIIGTLLVGSIVGLFLWLFI